jgi:hypothetical protein
MKKAHWSITLGNFISIDIEYNDNARQGWDYDCLQFDSLDSLRANMIADFRSPRSDIKSISIFVIKGDGEVSIELDATSAMGADFVDFIFDTLEEIN